MKYNIIEPYKYKDLERFTYAQLEADDIAIEKFPLVLYDAFETEFDNLGIAVLESTSNAVITEEVNGDYTLTAEILKDERGKYKRVKPFSIVKAQNQLFRIPMLQGIRDNEFKIVINAKHISFDAVEIYNENRIAKNQNVYETMSKLLEVDYKGKYSIGVTDVTSVSSADFIDENFIDSMFNKVLPRWGGELIRDNFKFTVKNRLGKYKPDLFVRYSKNSSSIKRRVDSSMLCTVIYPYGKSGITIQSVNDNVKYIKSSKAKDYPIEYIKSVKFEDAETPEQLKEKAVEYLRENDTVITTIEVDLIDLETVEAYENLKNAIRMNLGDTVTIYDEELMIDEEQRVISIDTDAVSGVKLKITLGKKARTLTDSVTEIDNKTSSIEAKVTATAEESKDISKIVTENTSDIEKLKLVDENLNKDITAVNKEIGQLAELETEDKTSLVRAINEVKNNSGGSDGGGGSGGTNDYMQIKDELPLKVTNGFNFILKGVINPWYVVGYNDKWYSTKLSEHKGEQYRFNLLNYNTSVDIEDETLTEFAICMKVTPNTTVPTVSVSGNSTNAVGVRGAYVLGAIHGKQNAGVGIQVGTNGINVACHGDSFAPFVATNTGLVVGAESWVCISYKSNVITVFLNGVLVATSPTIGRNVKLITGFQHGEWGRFNGHIEYLSMWSSTFKSSMMSDSLSGEETSLWEAYKFNDPNVTGGNINRLKGKTNIPVNNGVFEIK